MTHPRKVHLVIKRIKTPNDIIQNTYVTSNLKYKLLTEAEVVIEIMSKKVEKNRLTNMYDVATAEYFIKDNIKYIKQFFLEQYDIDFVIDNE